MDIDKLRYLLNSYEGPKLDFKERFSLEEDLEKKEFARDVCAIANSRGGRGYIIYGVKDKSGEIVGVGDTKVSEEKVQQIVTSRIEPPCQIRIEECEVDAKKLIVLTIFKSDARPHQVKHNGTFYIRRGSTTDSARRDEIAQMMQETGILSFETIMLGHVTIDMLNWDEIDKYLGSFKDLNEDNKLILVEALGIIKKDSKNEKYHPTMGGMLIFGKDVQTFLPNTGIKLYNDKEVLDLTGTINEMLDKAEVEIKRMLGDDKYPYKAIDLALANALAHRDYWDNTRYTTVKIYDNRIEITNPGALNQGDKVERVQEHDMAVRRNPWLYERLIMLDKNERYRRRGTGINQIKSLFKNQHEVKFINLLKYNTFKVVLPREYK
ncbi:MAG: putative DNA binding domain-containing protein [Clostridia bacterium]|nr:putative DNA binding domain-containing protein [Clostridia bacterium]